DALLATRRRHTRADALAAVPLLAELLPQADATPHTGSPQLSLLCRTHAQVEAALALDEVDEIVVDFLEVHGLKQACEAVRTAHKRLIVAAPRIFKPGEQRLWTYLCRLAPDALLVRSSGLLWQLQQSGGSGATLDDGTHIPTLHGDFALNASNLLAATQLLDMGLQRLTLTHDLNAEQCAALARGLSAERRALIEVVAH
ncbi:MAG: U32 family peptidase, partial [Gammaproteobacteria bacterium]|nr:U32 family peptidase [Gammaproteobacteria bacterium]